MTAGSGSSQRDRHLCQLRYPGICIGTATRCDHIVAVGLGGADTDDNCQGACKPCHDRKTSAEGHIAAGHTPRDYTNPDR